MSVGLRNLRRFSIARLVLKVCNHVKIYFRGFYLKFANKLKLGRERITHITLYSVGNVGDTVLSECVRKTFSKELIPIRWNLISVRSEVDNSIVNSINGSRCLLIGGGGLFLPDTNANTISGWQWACSSEYLKKIKVPIILFSVGYNYFRGQEPNRVFTENLNLIIERAEFVGLRNYGSIKAIRKLLRPELRDKVRYQPCTTTLIRKIANLPDKQRTGKIALNCAFDRPIMRYGEHKKEILDQISASLVRLEEKGYKIYYIAHVAVDLQFLEYLPENLKVEVVDASAWGFKRLTNFYNNMDLVMGMRGHAQMIPFGLNCHIISFGSHEKMKWFLDDIDAEDWYVELTEDVPHLSDRIIETFEKVHEKNENLTTKRLLEAQQRMYDVTRQNLMLISKHIVV